MAEYSDIIREEAMEAVSDLVDAAIRGPLGRNHPDLPTLERNSDGAVVVEVVWEPWHKELIELAAAVEHKLRLLAIR